MHVDCDLVRYLKLLAEETGMLYQTLINLYLQDYVVHQCKLQIFWSLEA